MRAGVYKIDDRRQLLLWPICQLHRSTPAFLIGGRLTWALQVRLNHTLSIWSETVWRYVWSNVRGTIQNISTH